MANAIFRAAAYPGADNSYGDLSLDTLTGALKVQVAGSAPSGTVDTDAPVLTAGRYVATLTSPADGERRSTLLDPWGNLRASMVGRLATPASSASVLYGYAHNSQTTYAPLAALSYVWNGTAAVPQPGDTTATYVRPPAQAASSTLSGTIATSGGTAAITFTNVTRTEVLNPSASDLWASWGTPAVNGAGSFKIVSNGSYAPGDRVTGTLTLLSTAVTQPYTINRFS